MKEFIPSAFREYVQVLIALSISLSFVKIASIVEALSSARPEALSSRARFRLG
jgi:hypothetical protein